MSSDFFKAPFYFSSDTLNTSVVIQLELTNGAEYLNTALEEDVRQVQNSSLCSYPKM